MFPRSRSAPPERKGAGQPVRLRPGSLAAPAARCLPLLPSGPGGIHRATLRETRSSTPPDPSGAHSFQADDLGSCRSTSAPHAFIGRAMASRRSRQPQPHPHWSARCGLGSGWRRGRDSNPGWSLPHTRSPGVLLQPLGHLSAFADIRAPFGWGDPTVPPWRDPCRLPQSSRQAGGEGGIRTHVGVAPQPAFEAGPLRPLRYLSANYFNANLTTDNPVPASGG